ncbi:TetR/AcrR family transcriptional regulator [Frankia sp. CNm7]|uniref:TetR/AcrR family transcriptional regulator n=1 Tax=Frankia nepalensis TaxID=1836974 RepID=A0A937RF48_9ACTN|nr:TetR/AcrR family transcriptional regulator [Frankia nepalensis]MBL7497978.1 TetR/AcrR family transcriptional regulator [Frankia nepalensis]MBL7509059.1 TetR/AcrR family transcriptional regulator [Frankia nepalensis]MBL7516838.1 TetR/AcrR family transcriptional regulator [Frankia nepalensis]MBL7627835.1 TetR/AcrR family transcriptional regulator [Frankia nepalensis]
MTTDPVARRRTGRPRDASIDARALDAARQLLTEDGFAATTIQAVADRAGVHASAIYRRWPSRIELIAEAVFPGPSPLNMRPTGDLRRDLRRFVDAYLEVFTAPAAREAAAGLLAHSQTSTGPRQPELIRRISARPQFADILRAAPPGSIDPAVDPDDAFDMLLGAILTRVLLANTIARHTPVERIVDMTIRMLRPDSTVATGPAALRRA